MAKAKLVAIIIAVAVIVSIVVILQTTSNSGSQIPKNNTNSTPVTPPVPQVPQTGRQLKVDIFETVPVQSK